MTAYKHPNLFIISMSDNIIKNERRDIYSLHLLKAICAICVVILHVPPVGLRLAILPFCRIAVPCFLLVSGYFLVGSEGISQDRIKRATLKIIKLILFSNFVYLCFRSFENYVNNGTWVLDKWMTFDFWIDNLIGGGSLCGPLWYLNSYCQGLIVLYLVCRFSNKLTINMIKFFYHCCSFLFFLPAITL